MLFSAANATHILNGDKLAFAQPPSMNRETFSSVVLSAQRAPSAFSCRFAFPHHFLRKHVEPGTCQSLSEFREQQLVPTKCVHGWHTDEVRVVDAADVAAQSVQGGTVESRASPLTGQKEARASRRCEAEFWQIDPLAMTDPLTQRSYRRAATPPRHMALSPILPPSRPIVWFRQDFRIRDNPVLHHGRAAQAEKSCHLLLRSRPR